MLPVAPRVAAAQRVASTSAKHLPPTAATATRGKATPAAGTHAPASTSSAAAPVSRVSLLLASAVAALTLTLVVGENGRILKLDSPEVARRKAYHERMNLDALTKRKEVARQQQQQESRDEPDAPDSSDDAGSSGSKVPGGAAASGAMDELSEEADQQSAFDPETNTINWDCPCLGGMAHGPCGEEFKKAFSCFVFSEQEPKGIDCVENFKGMQDCFRQHPEHYKEELEDFDEADAAGDAEAPAPARAAAGVDGGSGSEGDNDDGLRELRAEMQKEQGQ